MTKQQVPQMAKSARAKGSNIFVWILLGLLALGLTGFGMGGIGQNTIQSIGAVGDEEVSVEVYARALSNELRALSDQVGGHVTLAQAQQFGIDRSVLNQVFTVAALDGEARRIHVSVGDDRVRRELYETQAFQAIDGSFDKNAYDFALEQSNLSPSEYDELVRDNNARAILQIGISRGLLSSDVYASTLLEYLGESRSFEWAALTADQLESPARTPTNAEAQTFYEANPEQFTTPEVRRISYVILTPDMLIDTVDVDEAALQILYDEQFDRFNTPERRIIDRIAFATVDEAQVALSRISSGEIGFDDLAAERDLAPADMDMGDVVPTDLTAEARVAVFAVEQPGVVGPAQSSLGPALFRVNAILNAQSTSFEQAREELLIEFASDRTRRLVADSASDIDDLLAGGAILEEIAAETAMEFRTIELTAETQDGPAAYEAFWVEANSAQEGDFPEIFDLADGGIFALRLNGITPPALLDFSTVADQAVVGWQQQETLRLLRERGTNFQPQLNTGVDFADVGLTTTDAINLRRDGFVDGPPSTLITDMFELNIGQTAVVDNGAVVFVARLTEITAFDFSENQNGSIRDSLIAEIDTQIGNDIFDLFVGALQDSAGLRLDHGAINAIHTQFP